MATASQALPKVKAQAHQLFGFTLHAACFFLDARSLVQLSRVDRGIHEELTDQTTATWLIREGRQRSSTTSSNNKDNDNNTGSSSSADDLAQRTADAFPELECYEQLRIAELLQELSVRVDFQWGSTELTEVAEHAINKLADVMHKHPELTVVIEGHCGIEAPPHVAPGFSLGRAESIKEQLLLTHEEIDESRIECVGRGNSRALAAAAGPTDPRAQANRRVDITLLLGGKEFPPKQIQKVISQEEVDAANERHWHMVVGMQINQHMQQHLQEQGVDPAAWNEAMGAALDGNGGAAEWNAAMLAVMHGEDGADMDEEEDSDVEDSDLEEIGGGID